MLRGGLILLVALAFPMDGQAGREQAEHIDIQTRQGMLRLTPMNDNAIRVRLMQNNSKAQEELVFCNVPEKTDYKVKDKDSCMVLSLPAISVIYGKTDETLTFSSGEIPLI